MALKKITENPFGKMILPVKLMIERRKCTLIILTKKSLEKRLQIALKEIQPERDYEICYYQNLHSKNQFLNYDQIILVGITIPNKNTILMIKSIQPSLFSDKSIWLVSPNKYQCYQDVPITEPGSNFPLDLIPPHYKEIDTGLPPGYGYICFDCIYQSQKESEFICRRSRIPEGYTRHRTFSQNGLFHVPNGDFDAVYIDDYIENCNHYEYDSSYYLRPVF